MHAYMPCSGQIKKQQQDVNNGKQVETPLVVLDRSSDMLITGLDISLTVNMANYELSYCIHHFIINSNCLVINRDV